MGLSFKNASALEVPWTRWFFYGPSGSGKTQLCSSFPRPVFIIPKNEGSIVTLRGQDIPYYESIDMSSQVRSGVGGLNRILDELERTYSEDPQNFPFDTIVLESLTHYSELVVEEISAQPGFKQMSPREWGEVASHFRNVHSRLSNMQVHVVYTSLERIDKNDAGVVIAGPFLSGAAAIKLPSACDVIGFTEVQQSKGGTKYNVHFKKHGFFPARSRFDALPDVVEDFHFDDIAQFLTQGNTTR